MLKVNTQAPLFADALIFIETPHRGSDRVWYANNLRDAVIKCVEQSTQRRRGDEADELSEVDTLEQLKAIIGADLRSLDVYAHNDFKSCDLDSFDGSVIRAAKALGFVEEALDAEDAEDAEDDE